MIVKLIVAASILAITWSESRTQPGKFNRLPNNTKPISYDLHFQTYIYKYGFTLNGTDNKGGFRLNGTAQIRIQILEDSDRIVLHAYNYCDVNITLIDLEKEHEIDNLEYDFDILTEQMIITAAPTALKLVAGKEYSLKISYHAMSSCDYNLRHRYCMQFNLASVTWDTVPFSLARFSQGNARRVFPCYDEPALKANFNISITHEGNYTALSNMPRKGEPVAGANGYVTTHFLESPMMSPNLVIVTLTKCENVTEKVDDTDVRFFCKSKSQDTPIFLEVSKKAIFLMQEYFKIKFPFPKIDFFPEFWVKPKTMNENKGIITYLEHDVFDGFIPQNKTPENCKEITTEIANMWFGNLVTSVRWSQDWLSKGISTYYGVKFINLIKPDWNLTIDNHFLWYSADDCSLSCNAKYDWKYESVFGKIPSVKGAFLMSMLEKLLTEKVLRKGLIKYLKKFQYSSVTEDDLFDCLADSMEDSSNPYFNEKESFKKAMKSWTTQRYHPVVLVDRNYKSGTFTLKQEPYKTLDEGNGEELWWIPITFATSTSLNFDNLTADFIFPGVKEVEINPTELGKTLASKDWLILNKQQSGLYRVAYDERNWNLITCALLKDPNIIPEITKSHMILDIFELFLEGYVKAPVFFNFLYYLKSESSQIPWLAASSVLKQIFKYIENYEEQPKQKLKQFVVDIISNASNFFDADENSENFELSPKNEFLFKLACDVEIKKCGRVMDYIFYKVNSSGKMSIIDEKMTVYAFCYEIKHSKKDIKLVMDLLVNSETFFYKTNIFACHKNKNNLKMLLTRVLNGTISSRRIARPLYLAMSEPASLEAFVELIRENENFNLFAGNVDSVLLNVKTKEHKELVLQAWKEIELRDKLINYSINKKIERNDKIRRTVLHWLKHDPPITNINCLQV